MRAFAASRRRTVQLDGVGRHEAPLAMPGFDAVSSSAFSFAVTCALSPGFPSTSLHPSSLRPQSLFCGPSSGASAVRSALLSKFSLSRLLLFLLLALLLLAVHPEKPAPGRLPGVAAAAAPSEQPQLKIGPAQVLLPSPAQAAGRLASASVSVRTLLIVENGSSLAAAPCFFWSVQHPDLIRVLHPDCAPSQPASACLLPSTSLSASGAGVCLPRVLVEASHHTPHKRGRSWIFASPGRPASSPGRQVSPSALRVQAVVAPIARIAFRTRDRRLAVGQLGDVGVLAFDEEGNIFTSLQGLVFIWKFEGERGVLQAEDITSDAEAASATRQWVERSSQSASGVHTPDSAAGPFWRSDMLLVRGLKTGKATISVRLAGDEHRHVGEARVSFVVHEPVLLLPAFQVLPPAAVFQYRLLRLQESSETVSGGGVSSLAVSRPRSPAFLSLPAPHIQFSADDLSLFDAEDRLPLARAVADAGASAIVAIDRAGLLRVVSPEFPGEGENARRFGLEGASLLRAVDTRTGEEQHAEVQVLVPSALRVFVDDVGDLERQPTWSSLAAAVEKQVRSLGDAQESHDVLLRRLVERDWTFGGAGERNSKVDAFAPQEELRMRLVKTGRARLGGDAAVDEDEEEDDVLVLVRGREYLFKVEMLARGLPRLVSIPRQPETAPRETETLATETLATEPVEKEAREALSRSPVEEDSQFLAVATPKNAVFHWTCEDEGEEEESADDASESRPESQSCGLQRKGSGQQHMAWFSASQRSQGRLTASLLHVGSRASGAKAFWEPPVPLSLSLRFRVVDPVFLLFFPRPRGERGEEELGVRLSSDQPLLLPPLHSFVVEPWGGSGAYTLTSSDASLISVESLPASPQSPPFESSQLLAPFVWGEKGLRAARPSSRDSRQRFRLQNPAVADGETRKRRPGETGVAVLRLEDARQPQNAFEFLVVIAEPERVEISLDSFLIGESRANEEHVRGDMRRDARERRGGQDASERNRQDATQAIAIVTAFARIPSTLALPPKVSQWFAQPSLSSSETSLEDAARAVQLAASEWGKGLDGDANEVSRHPLHRFPLQFANCTNLIPPAEQREEKRRLWTDKPDILMIQELRASVPYTCGVFRLTGKASGSARVFFSPSAALRAGATVDVFPPLELWVRLDRLLHPLPVSPQASPDAAALQAPRSARSAEQGLQENGGVERDRGAAGVEHQRPAGDACPTCASALLYSAPVAALAAGASLSGNARDDNVLSLAVGASLTFFTKGGPPERPAVYTQVRRGEVERADQQGTAAEVAILNGDRSVRVVCLRPGDTPAKILLEVSNRPKQGVHVHSVSTSVRLSIVCSVPRHLEIFPLPAFSTPSATVAAPEPVTLAAFPVAPAAASPQVSPVSPFASAPSLFLRCGATHRFVAVAYDALLQPVVNATSFAASSAWSLAGDEGATAETGPKGVSLVSFFDLETRVGRGNSRVDERPRDAFIGSAEAAAVQVDSTSCCGVHRLSVHLQWPTAESMAGDTALRQEDQALLLRSLKEAREALHENGSTTSAWRDDLLSSTLSLVVLPPPRFLASNAFLPGFFPPVKEASFAPLRLFYHPEMVYRLLLQFTSPQTRLKVLPASSVSAVSSTAPFRVYTETPGPRLLADANSGVCSALSPEATVQRFSSLFRHLFDSRDRSASKKERPLPALPREGLDVATLVLGATQTEREGDLASPLLRLEPPFSWPTQEVCSPSCPVTSQEVFVLPSEEVGRDSSGGFVASGLLAVDDVSVLGDHPRSERLLAGQKKETRPALELQFFRVARVSLAVSPPETLLGSEQAEGGEQGGEQGGWIQGAWGEVEKGKAYGVKVSAFAADGKRLAPAFYPAMDLTLTISKKRKTPRSETLQTASQGREVTPDATTPGWLYVHRVRDGRLAEAQQVEAQLSKEETDMSATVSFRHKTRSFDFFPSRRGSHSHERKPGQAEVEALASETRCGERFKQNCPDFFFFVDGFEPDAELVLSVRAVNWEPALSPHASGVSTPVSAEMTLALYPPLQVSPASLVLLPGGHSLQLTVRGGPCRRRDSRSSERGGGSSRLSAVRGCVSSDSAVVAAQVVEDGGFVLTSDAASEESRERRERGDILDETEFRVVELVTGEEGAAVVTVHAGDPTAEETAVSAPRTRLLRRAAATVQVIVALPTRVVVRRSVSGGNGFVGEPGRSLHRLDAARMGAVERTPVERGGEGEAARKGDSFLQEETLQLGLESVQKLHALLYDSEGREFNLGHLTAPTGRLAGPGVDRATSEGQRKLQLFGPVAALPPATASVCTYSWRVVESSSVVGLLDPSAMDLFSELSGAACTNASALPLPAAAASLRQSLSGSLPSVSVVGLRSGTARLHLRVECSARRQRDGSRAAKSSFLETEVSIVVSPSPFSPTPASSQSLVESPLSSFSTVASAVAGLSPLPAAKPSGPEWWTELFSSPRSSVSSFLFSASPSSLSSPLLVAPAAEYRLPCCVLRVLPVPDAACVCASRPREALPKAPEAARESGLESEVKCSCAEPTALQVLPGDGGFVTSSSLAAALLKIEARPASRAFAARPPEAGRTDKDSREEGEARDQALWLTARVDVTPVASVELRLRERTMALGGRQRVELLLKDALGRRVLPPTDIRLDVFSSHPSVISAEVEAGDSRHPFGAPVVALQASATQAGCAAVTVFLLAPAFLSDTVLVCTDSRASPSPGVARRLASAEAVPVLPGSVVHVLPDSRVYVHRVRPHLSFRLTFRLQPLLSALLALGAKGALGTAGGSAGPPVHLFPDFVWQEVQQVAASSGCVSVHAVARLVDRVAPSLAQSLHLSLAGLFRLLRRPASLFFEAASTFSPAFSVGEPLLHFSEETDAQQPQRFALCTGRPSSRPTASSAGASSPALVASSLSLKVTLNDVPAVLAALVSKKEESEGGKADGELSDFLLRVDGVSAFFSLLRKQLASAWWREQQVYRRQKEASEESCEPRRSARSRAATPDDNRQTAELQDESGVHAAAGCTYTLFGRAQDVPSSVTLFFSLVGFLDWSASFSPSTPVQASLCSSPFFACPTAHAVWNSSRPAVASVHTPRIVPARLFASAASNAAAPDVSDVEGPTAVALAPGLATISANNSAVLRLGVLPSPDLERDAGRASELGTQEASKLRLLAAAGCAGHFVEKTESQRTPLLTVASAAWMALSGSEMLSVSRLQSLGACATEEVVGRRGELFFSSFSSRIPATESKTPNNREEPSALFSPRGEVLFFRLQASPSAGTWTDVASSVYVQSSGSVQCAVSDPRLAPLFVAETTQLPLLSFESEERRKAVGVRLSEQGRVSGAVEFDDEGDLLVAHACALQERRLLSVRSDLPRLLRLSTPGVVASVAPSETATHGPAPSSVALPCGPATLSASQSSSSLPKFSLPVSVSLQTSRASRLLAFSPARLLSLADERGAERDAETLLRQRARYLFETFAVQTPRGARPDVAQSRVFQSACLALPFKPKMRVLFDARCMSLAAPQVVYVKATQRQKLGDGEGHESEKERSEELEDFFKEAHALGSLGDERQASVHEERSDDPARGSAALHATAETGAKLPLTLFVYPVPPVAADNAAAAPEQSRNRVSVDVSVSSEAYTVQTQQRGLLLAIRVSAATSPTHLASGDRASRHHKREASTGNWSVWTAPEAAQLTIESREWRQIVSLSLEPAGAVRQRREEKGEETLLFPSAFFSSSSERPLPGHESERVTGARSEDRRELKREVQFEQEEDSTQSLGEWLLLLLLLLGGGLFLLHRYWDFFRGAAFQSQPLPPRDETAVDKGGFATSAPEKSVYPGLGENSLLMREKARLQAARQADAEALSNAFSTRCKDEQLSARVRTPQQKLQMQPDGQWKWVA
uniref:Putative transmembrane protein n=3 Tax=Toxoplasma gondii TaxID=5811 RepID=A0A2T6IHC5_TOXGO|nr:putative transmembrane protein [Toxoplasma gondii TgCATBr9]